MPEVEEENGNKVGEYLKRISPGEREITTPDHAFEDDPRMATRMLCVALADRADWTTLFLLLFFFCYSGRRKAWSFACRINLSTPFFCVDISCNCVAQ